MNANITANGGGGGSTGRKTVTFEASDVQIQNWVDDGEVTHETVPSRLAIEEAGGERHPGEGWEASDGRMFQEVELKYKGDNTIKAVFEKASDYVLPDSGDRASGGDADIYDDDELDDDREVTTLPFDDSLGISDAAEAGYEEGREAAEAEADPEEEYEPSEQAEEAFEITDTVPGVDTSDLPAVDTDSDAMNERLILAGGAAAIALILLIALIG